MLASLAAAKSQCRRCMYALAEPWFYYSGMLSSGKLWWWSLVPTSSSHLAQQNGTLRFWRKYPNHWHTFLCENKKFASESEPNRALFWGDNPKLMLVLKNSFQRYIISLCLKSFAKSYTFPTVYNCKANQDSESGSKTTLGLILMLQIQWQSQNW